MRMVVAALLFGWSLMAAEKRSLNADAAILFKQAQLSEYYATAAKLKPQLEPTSDGRSFFVIWKAAREPKQWIVSLHGSNGFATDDLAIWHSHLKGCSVGLICLQWWFGKAGDPGSYYTPLAMYREIDQLLQRLGVTPGTVMFQGFSRGSANSFAVAAIDHGRGRGYFKLCVASSGGVGLDYPPTRDIAAGEFGVRPLEGTRWITCAGGRDANPGRDGIEGMRRTAAWLKEQGANVLFSIEDAAFGHGALMTNPKNAKRVLDQFFSSKS